MLKKCSKFAFFKCKKSKLVLVTQSLDNSECAVSNFLENSKFYAYIQRLKRKIKLLSQNLLGFRQSNFISRKLFSIKEGHLHKMQFAIARRRLGSLLQGAFCRHSNASFLHYFCNVELQLSCQMAL